MIDFVRTSFKVVCMLGISVFLMTLIGCASTKPAEIRLVETTKYVVVEVPESYLAATPIATNIKEGCTGQVDWKECATSRSKYIVNLLGNIGQCNADKYKASVFITDQTRIVNERNQKKP